MTNSPRPLSTSGRLLLIGVLLLAAAGEVALHLMDGTSNDRQLIIGLISFALVGAFAWSPSSAVVGLLLLSTVETIYGNQGSYLLVLAAASGLVAYTCEKFAVILYVSASTILFISTTLTSEALTVAAPIALTLVGVASWMIGRSLKRYANRESSLLKDIELTQRKHRNSLRKERQRISDELHDIIAHDLTLIYMHASILERSPDAALAQTSIETVGTRSRQALTDIRRVLAVVNPDRTSDISEGNPTHSIQIADCLRDSREELEELGMEVKLKCPAEAELTASIRSAFVQIAKELTTNVVKHAAPATPVRIEMDIRGDTAELCFMNAVTPSDQPDQTLVASGYGLARIRERARLLGGNITVDTYDGLWSVTVTLPTQ